MGIIEMIRVPGLQLSWIFFFLRIGAQKNEGLSAKVKESLTWLLFSFGISPISWGYLLSSLKQAPVSVKSDSLFPLLLFAMPVKTYINSCMPLPRVLHKIRGLCPSVSHMLIPESSGVTRTSSYRIVLTRNQNQVLPMMTEVGVYSPTPIVIIADVLSCK